LLPLAQGTPLLKNQAKVVLARCVDLPETHRESI